MEPQPCELVFVLASDCRGLGDALEHFGQVPQVVSVMGLGRGGPELFLDSLEYVNGGVNNLLFEFHNGIRELLGHQEPLHDHVINDLQRLDSKGLHVYFRKVPEVSLSYMVAANSRGAHGCYELDLLAALEVLAVFVVEFIPTARVHPLSQQLDGRLRSVLLLLRHVQVIHEDDHPPVLSRHIALPPLFQLRLHEFLCLFGGSLSAESNAQVSPDLIVVELP